MGSVSESVPESASRNVNEPSQFAIPVIVEVDCDPGRIV